MGSIGGHIAPSAALVGARIHVAEYGSGLITDHYGSANKSPSTAAKAVWSCPHLMDTTTCSERLGDAALGQRILDLYGTMSGDMADRGLVSFYKCYRACLWAKIAVWHLHDPEVRDPKKWRTRALEYLDLGTQYAAGFD